MSAFNSNNPGNGENPLFSAPNMSISDPIGPSIVGGTDCETGPAPAAPAYDAAAIGPTLPSHEDDDVVDIHTTLEAAGPLPSTTTPPSGKSTSSSSTMFQYRHPSLPALHTEDDTSGQHHPLDAALPNPSFSSDSGYRQFEPAPARHDQHEGARHHTMMMHCPPSSHSTISAAPVSSEYYDDRTQAGVPIGDQSQAANDSSSGEHMLRLHRHHMIHPDGVPQTAYSYNLQQADRGSSNEQAPQWSQAVHQSISGDTRNMSLRHSALPSHGISSTATNNRSQQRQEFGSQAGIQPQFGSLPRRYDLSSPSYDHYGGHRDAISSTVPYTHSVPDVVHQHSPGEWAARSHPDDAHQPAFGDNYHVQPQGAASHSAGTFPVAHGTNVSMPMASATPLDGVLHHNNSAGQQLDQPIMVQLMNGEWITVAAIHTASSSSTTAQPLPTHHAQDGRASVSSVPQKPPAQFPAYDARPFDGNLSSSGIDPCEEVWSEADIDSVEEDTHTLSAAQRAQVLTYNRQLIRHQAEGEAVDFSRRNVVDTMCVLWPIPCILESATRRTKVSTIHELLQHYTKHYSSYITGVTNDLKRKEGPELQLAIRTTINSMYLVRNEYPLEIIQLALLLHITDKIRDTRLSAKIQMIKHLANEAMWTQEQDLPDLWENVKRLHESPMEAQLQAQSHGRDIWSSPGVTTFSPHHIQYTETWANFFRSCLHVLCYQPQEFVKKHFEHAMNTFEDSSWKQLSGQHVREFNSFFQHKLGLLRQAAVLDGLQVEDVLPKRLALVISYKNRLLHSKREACLRSLKRKTYKHDHPTLDLDYAGNTLDNLTLPDFMILSSVAWREEDFPDRDSAYKP